MAPVISLLCMLHDPRSTLSSLSANQIHLIVTTTWEITLPARLIRSLKLEFIRKITVRWQESHEILYFPYRGTLFLLQNFGTAKLLAEGLPSLGALRKTCIGMVELIPRYPFLGLDRASFVLIFTCTAQKGQTNTTHEKFDTFVPSTKKSLIWPWMKLAAETAGAYLRDLVKLLYSFSAQSGWRDLPQEFLSWEVQLQRP